MGYVAYTFSRFIRKDLVLNALENTKDKVCFADWGKDYKPNTNVYLLLSVNEKFFPFFKVVKSFYSNYNLKLLVKEEHYIYDDGGWGFRSDKKLKGKKLLGMRSKIVVKINPSKEFSDISRYVATYLMAVILRMFSLNEGYIECFKLPEEVTLETLIKLNNSSRGNSNHKLSSDPITIKTLEILNDVESLNKFFEENSDISLKGFFVDSTLSKVGDRIYQTRLLEKINEYFGIIKMKKPSTRKVLEPRFPNYAQKEHKEFEIVPKEIIEQTNFEIGDLIIGKNKNIYGYTTSDAIMICSRHLGTAIYVKILEHREFPNIVGKGFRVNPRFFNKIEDKEIKEKYKNDIVLARMEI